ncbi:MAG: hypothetical protein GY811_29955 [Myxococcales bacterium]|nr:hypothetical protein [Myxococcales bacterium]
MGEQNFARALDRDCRGGEQIFGGIDVEHSARPDEGVKERSDFGSSFTLGSVVILSA